MQKIDLNYMKKIIFAALTTVVFLSFIAFLYFNKNLRRAELSWDVMADPDIAGYNVYYGASPRNGDCPADGGYPGKADAKKTGQFILNNLELGRTYYFSVTSYDNSDNESCFSGEVEKNIPNNFLFKIFKPVRNMADRWL